jgi:hypothetical protein
MFQQMRLILYLYFLCFLSPYMFRALTGPSSGVSWAACLFHHLAPILIINIIIISGNTWQVVILCSTFCIVFTIYTITQCRMYCKEWLNLSSVTINNIIYYQYRSQMVAQTSSPKHPWWWASKGPKHVGWEVTYTVKIYIWLHLLENFIL